MAQPALLSSPEQMHRLRRLCAGGCDICFGPKGHVWRSIVKQKLGIDVDSGECPIERAAVRIRHRQAICSECEHGGGKCGLYGGAACRWRGYMRRPGAVCLMNPPKWKPESLDNGQAV